MVVKTVNKGGKALTKYDARFAEMAARAKKAESSLAAGNAFYKLKSGILSFQNATVPGNTLQCVVLAARIENAYRPDDFDEANPQPPACYAFGTDFKTMGPNSEWVEEPVSVKCCDCPNAEFGSSERGKGPACSTQRRRLVLVPVDQLDDVANADLRFLSLSYFSSTEWKGYVDQLADAYGRPPWGAVTRINVVPDARSQFRVKFQFVELLPAELNEAVDAAAQRAEGKVEFPYPKAQEDLPAAAKGAAKTGPRGARVTGARRPKF